MNTFERYIRDVSKEYRSGAATEHTYRPAFIGLLQNVIPDYFSISNERRHKVYGAPDITISRDKLEYGYLETKIIGANLNKLENSEQINRYRNFLDNFILTDYLEFRWFQYGEKKHIVKLGELRNDKIRLLDGGPENHQALLQAFVSQPAPAVGSAKELAKRMAYYAQQMRSIIRRALRDEMVGNVKDKPLTEQYLSFADILIRGLTRDDFADLYAQTLCYGMFASRMQQKEEEKSLGALDRARPNFGKRAFDRMTPLAGIQGNPLLTRAFSYFAGADIHDDVVWALEEVGSVFQHADMSSIKRQLDRASGQGDPVMQFYETFLAAYDPALREKRGVYYTPEPVVSYMVRSVDHLLKTKLGVKKGLADNTKLKDGSHKVQILDPSTGTGTYLHNIIRHIYDGFSGNQGMWQSYAKEHLLPRINGFEFLIAPYTVAHLKLYHLLARTGVELQGKERVNIYLTNTLEKPEKFESGFAFARDLYQESQAAATIKQNTPVMVVIGNPPYSGHSANGGEWIHNLLRGVDTLTGKPTGNYFEVDGEGLNERNPKYLNDDYVKFIRFAQWRIEKTGDGILAFITNHGYLDNPTFRGMRQSLMETFDDIYVFDLHGNARKGESAPDGSKDENVFDIQQGVAICFMVKHQRTGELFEKQPAKVHHADLWGVRESFETKGKEKHLVGGKYKWLSENDLANTSWKPIEPASPFYLFVPQAKDVKAEYEQAWSLSKVMPLNVNGFKTHRDHFAVAFDKGEIQRRIEDLKNPKISDVTIKEKYDLQDTGAWKVQVIRARINQEESSSYLIESLYRPFDMRHTWFSSTVMDRPRRELTQHVWNRKNLNLMAIRQMMDATPYSHVFVTRVPAVDRCFACSRGAAIISPLYLYPEEDAILDPDGLANDQRKPNLSQSFVDNISQRVNLRFISEGVGDLKRTFGPEDMFHYIYALLHSPSYRKRYADFLKIDFPRIPLTSNASLFKSLCGFGKRLVDLHLMEADVAVTVTFPNSGSNVIGKPKYLPPTDKEPGRVHINEHQVFEGVTAEVWSFFVGGYQVCEKWLKDRKGRELSFEDIEHYQKMVAAISQTIALMENIDECIEAAGGFPIK